MGIVVIGATFVDIKGYPYETFVPQGRNSGWIEQVHGGVCRNVVEDIANLELRPTFVSLIDESGLGESVIKKLNNHKVNTEYVKSTPDGLGTWLAVFDHNGDLVSAISKRPDLRPIAEILKEKGDELFSKCDSVAVEIEMNEEVMDEVFRLSKKYGTRIFAGISNMSIAMKRRHTFKDTACLICNKQEAGILFAEDYDDKTPEEMIEIVSEKTIKSTIPNMVVTLGEEGAVYASSDGIKGYCPAIKTDVVDTTGAGDAFFAGVTAGMTYGKSLAESCEIGTRLASCVIATTDNVCPRFMPGEFGLDVKIED